MVYKKYFLRICVAGIALWNFHLQGMYPNTVVATISAAEDINDIAITPNGNYAYVTNGSGYVYVIPTSLNEITDTITLTDLNPISVATSSDNNHFYVTFDGENEVLVFQTSDNTQVNVIELPFDSSPSYVAVNPNGNYIYVANSGTNTVNAISTLNYMITATVNLASGASPDGIAVSPNGNYIYVANSGTNTVNAISTLNYMITATVNLATGASPDGIAITPNGNYVYVGNSGNDTVNAISTLNYIITATVNLATGASPDAIAITPNGNYVYVGNSGTNTINVIQISDNTIVDTITLAPLASVSSLAVTPNGNYVYATDSSNGIVDVIGLGLSAPADVGACKYKNVFLGQTDFINMLSWQAPAIGTIAEYKIYRDAELTQLVATVPATTLSYADHNRVPGVAYTYYIVAIDSSGNVSPAANATALNACTENFSSIS